MTTPVGHVSNKCLGVPQYRYLMNRPLGVVVIDTAVERDWASEARMRRKMDSHEAHLFV